MEEVNGKASGDVFIMSTVSIFSSNTSILPKSTFLLLASTLDGMGSHRKVRDNILESLPTA